ncbi:MAG: hypothetical protein ACXAB4_05470 [Candidatus Hodarchaeales archaeon]|jgi:hypothetical protein
MENEEEKWSLDHSICEKMITLLFLDHHREALFIHPASVAGYLLKPLNNGENAHFAEIWWVFFRLTGPLD